MSIDDELYDYQRDCVEFVVARPGSAIFCEQGTGKTYITAGVVSRLSATHDVMTALCVVPLANRDTSWMSVLGKLKGVSLHTEWTSFKASRAKARVLVMHYEALRGKDVKKIVKAKWTFVAYDESQRLKQRGSKQSRTAARFSNVQHRLVLSGTPIEQAPQDLWAQFRFAIPEVFGKRWADFDGDWLKPCGFMGYDRQFIESRLPLFLKTIEPHIRRLTKAEVLDLPSMTFIESFVDLEGTQRRVYRDLEKRHTTTLNGEEIVCDLKITELVRLQQVVGGFIRDESGASHHVGKAKSRRLVTILKQEPTSVVVFCKYREEVDICTRAAQYLGRTVGVISGKTRATRSQTILDFQAGRIDVLVCMIRAGGVGIDLFHSHVVVFYSCTYSSIDFDQAVCRVHRNGQQNAVRIYVIQATNTVDTIIYSALLMKKKISFQVLDHRRLTMSAKTAKPVAPVATKKPAAKAAPAAAPVKSVAKAAPAAAKTETAPAADAAPVVEKAKRQPPPQPPKPAFGVPELAAALGINGASVRVKLRNKVVPKNGKVYGWDNEADFKAVLAILQTKDAAPAKEEPATEAPAEEEAEEGAEEEETEEDEEAAA